MSNFTTFLYVVVSWGQTDRKLNNLESPLKRLGCCYTSLCVGFCCVCSPGALRALIQDNTGTESGLEQKKSRGGSAFRGVQFLVLVTEKDLKLCVRKVSWLCDKRKGEM